jgi:hypothetical protein
MPGLELSAYGRADGSLDTVVLACPDIHDRPVGRHVSDRELARNFERI